MTFTEIKTQVRNLVGQVGTTNARLDDTALGALVNRAYRDLAAARKAFRRETGNAELTTSASVQEYGAPSDIIIVEGVRYSSTQLLPTTIEALNAWVPNWRSTAAGVPVYWYPAGDDTRRFGLYPKPSAGSVNVNITGPCVPVDSPPSGGFSTLSAGGDIPLLPLEQHDDIVDLSVQIAASGHLANAEGSDGRYQAAGARLGGRSA